MGIITDQLRLAREQGLDEKAATAEAEIYVEREERAKLKRLKSNIPNYIAQLQQKAESVYLFSGRVECVRLLFYRTDDEMLLPEHPGIVREIESGLKSLEANTLGVRARRCRYERATRSGIDTRPSVELVAEFCPPLT